MRRPGAYGVKDARVPNWVGNLAVRLGRWSRVLTIDPIIYQWLRTRCGKKVAERAVLTPDPVEPFTPIGKRAARSRGVGIARKATFLRPLHVDAGTALLRVRGGPHRRADARYPSPRRWSSAPSAPGGKC